MIKSIILAIKWQRAIKLFSNRKFQEANAILEGIHVPPKMEIAKEIFLANTFLGLGKPEIARQKFECAITSLGDRDDFDSAYLKLFCKASLAAMAGDNKEVAHVESRARMIPCHNSIKKWFPV